MYQMSVFRAKRKQGPKCHMRLYQIGYHKLSSLSFLTTVSIVPLLYCRDVAAEIVLQRVYCSGCMATRILHTHCGLIVFSSFYQLSILSTVSIKSPRGLMRLQCRAVSCTSWIDCRLRRVCPSLQMETLGELLAGLLQSDLLKLNLDKRMEILGELLAGVCLHNLTPICKISMSECLEK